MPYNEGVKVEKVKALDGVTGTTTSAGVRMAADKSTHIGAVSGSGAVSGTILVEGSADGLAYHTLATLTISGANYAAASAVETKKMPYTRHDLTAVSGTANSWIID